MCEAVKDAFALRGRDCVITGGLEGVHTKGSEHYVGHALDWRTHHIPATEAEDIRDEVAAALGADFDVLLEENPVHLHVEWDPK
jgi:hypothetical protein